MNFKNKIKKNNLFASLIKHFSFVSNLLIVLIFVFSLFYIILCVIELEDKEHESLKSTSNTIARTIVSNISYSTYQIHYVAKQMSKTDGNKVKINQILSTYKTNVNNNFDLVTTWNMYSWIDSNNKMTVDGFEGILKNPIDMKHRKYLSDCRLKPNKVILGNPIKGAISNRIIIPVAVGVTDDYEKYLGTIVYGIDVEKLTANLEILNRDNLSRFLLIDEDKQIILESSSKNYNENVSIINQLKIDKNFYNKSFIAQNYNFINVNKLEKINNSNRSFYLVIINDNQLFKEKLYNLVIKKSLICIIFSLIIIFFLNKLDRKFVRPIAILLQYAENIRNHKYNTLLLEDLGAKEFEGLYKALSSIEKHINIEESLKKDLTETNEQLTKLTKSINHDLRNYVSGISGLSEIIIDDLKLENKYHSSIKLADMIISQSSDMLNFIKELLDKDLEKEKIKSESFYKNNNCDVKKLIEEILFLDRKFFEQNNVKVYSKIADNLPNAKIDKITLRRILDNLINNAVKYSYQNSEVKIDCVFIKEKNQIYIAISDSGIGMTQEEIAMALEGDGLKIEKKNTGKIIDSHGIGLPLVQEMIKKAGAEFKINSKKQVGTKVEIWLKALENNNSYKKLILKKASLNKTILVVDDEATNKTILKYFLENEGFKVLLAETAEEAFDIIENNSCDLIFMDNKLPTIDGIEATKIIRAGDIFKNFREFKIIPIISFSGNTDEESRKKEDAAGFSGHLGKPFNRESLLNILQDFLR